MSVAAMTMDDQRPMMTSTYTKYEQTMHAAATVGASGSGGATTTTTTIIPTTTTSASTTTNAMSAAPPSGPASPTPSGSEEPHHHHHHTPPQQQQLHHNTSSTSQQQQQPNHHHNHHHTHHHQQQQAVAAAAAAEQRQRVLEEEIEHLKLEQARLSQQCTDAQRREKILMRRLANKEQEFQDYVSQIAEYKAAQAPSAVALRSALLDPAVNLLFEKLKKELKATKAKLEETQNELSAWKFTPDSNTGKRLMAKCRLLYQENEELGKMTSNGRLAKLETELAMQKSFSEEVKKSQSELDDFLQELDEDVEGMQSTILYLQQELKTTRERTQALEKENFQLKTGIVAAGSEAAPSSLHTDQTELPVQMHIKLNGNQTNASTTADDLCQPQLQDDSTISTLTITNASSAAFMTTNDEVKYQTTTTTTTHNHTTVNVPVVGHLETIDENACLRSGTHDYYNGGLGVPSEVHQATPPAIYVDDGDMPSKFRSMASRKRNYDTTIADSNDVVVGVGGHTVATNMSLTSADAPVYTAQTTQPTVSTHVPRTLPPKKSKLRGVTPVRRSSVQSVDANDMVVDNNGGGSYNASMSTMEQTTTCNADNSNVMGVNEDASALMVNTMAEETTTSAVDNSGVAQRIMTRRRSVRTCVQNGSGGDSNH